MSVGCVNKVVPSPSLPSLPSPPLQLWTGLANHGTRGLDWPHILRSTFVEYSTPEDESLGVQIVKVQCKSQSLYLLRNTHVVTDLTLSRPQKQLTEKKIMY